MISLYHASDSPLHRAGPGWKIAALLTGSTGLFLFNTLGVMVLALALVGGLYTLAGIPARVAIAQIRPAVFLLGLIFAVQAFVVGLLPATIIVLRFGSLILAAGLVTLTTRMSDMVEGLERLLSPAARWLPVEKISLAIAMAIRFIPLMSDMIREVREAQRARGLERSTFAIAMPVMVRTLKMGSEIAEALDARSFGDPRRRLPGGAEVPDGSG